MTRKQKQREVEMPRTTRIVAVVAACAACLGSLASTASAAPSLSVTTLGAYAPINGALIYGTVSTGGQSVIYAFEYGTTTAYGSYTKIVSIPADQTAAQPVVAVVTGLQPGTTYHYRLVARSSSARYGLAAYGGDQTFSTPAAGQVQLPLSDLNVKNGVTSVPITCASVYPCNGTLTLTGISGQARDARVMTCAKTSFRGKPRAKLNIKVKLARACTAHHRRGSRLKARLTVVLKSFQHRFSRNVTLIL
jgi:hypothetical protein